TRRREDGRRRLPRRGPWSEHARARAPQAAVRSVGGTALAVSRTVRQNDRADRRREADARRAPRRGHGPEPRARWRRRRHRGRLRPAQRTHPERCDRCLGARTITDPPHRTEGPPRVLRGPPASFTRHLVVLQGGVTPKARREAMAHLAAIPSDEERLILATGR